MTEHSSGSVQILLSHELTQNILNYVYGIKSDLLVFDGIETEPHITVQYGFDSSKVSADDIARVVDNFGDVHFTLGALNSFHNDDADILYIEVISEDLLDLNAFLNEDFGEHINYDFPDYVPHITLAYMKPNSSSPYKFRQEFVGISESVEIIEYSLPNEEKYEIHLDGGFGIHEEIEGAITDGSEQFETEESPQSPRCPKHDWVAMGSVRPYEHSGHQKHIGIKSKEVCQNCGSLRWKNLGTGRRAAQVDD